MISLFFLLVIFLLSVFLTWAIRRYAISRNVIDIPTARSSHSNPTPRGGGVAIVLAFLCGLPVLSTMDYLPWYSTLTFMGAGAGVAIIGFLDDHGHIPARWRLLGHFAAAVWAIYWLGKMPSVVFFGAEFELGWLGTFMVVLYLVWMLNLYNFMDGIDGIASVEAIFACLGACLLYSQSGFESLIVAPLVLAMAVSGFLCWNFPPARIFMGDAGSGFLGIILGILSLQAASASPKLLWSWLILLGVFIVDATFTLLRRLMRGDKVYEAHRSHAYQFASRRYGSHLPVTMVVAAINVFWLLPVAASVVLWEVDGTLALIVAYVPLVALAVCFQAGKLERA